MFSLLNTLWAMRRTKLKLLWVGLQELFSFINANQKMKKAWKNTGSIFIAIMCNN